MGIRIDKVEDGRAFQRFLAFPETVYRGDPQWIPALQGETEFLLGDRNPFFHHAEAACFIATDGSGLTGRIAAIVDRSHVNFHHEQTGFFGFYECLPDALAAGLLLDRAAAWLRERDIEVMRGPLNPSSNETCGFLLEGYDAPPVFMTPYNPPYYHDHMRQYGLGKAKDLYAYEASLAGSTPSGRLERIADGARRRLPGLSVRHIESGRTRKELSIIKDIYNSALEHQWGFVPMTGEEIDLLAERLKDKIDPELVLIAELRGYPVGFLLALPDHNQSVTGRRGAGRIGSFFSRGAGRGITTIRIRSAGIREEHRRKGIDALLYLEAFRAALRNGYERAEMSWILEDNVLMQRGCEMMGGTLKRKCRIYEKTI